jgi:hypothetical protein
MEGSRASLPCWEERCHGDQKACQLYAGHGGKFLEEIGHSFERRMCGWDSDE